MEQSDYSFVLYSHLDAVVVYPEHLHYVAVEPESRKRLYRLVDRVDYAVDLDRAYARMASVPFDLVASISDATCDRPSAYASFDGGRTMAIDDAMQWNDAVIRSCHLLDPTDS